jgi:chromosomal replication initiation ATPase DnaA
MKTTVLDEVMRDLVTRVPRPQFATWFAPLRFVSDDGATLRVFVPNELFRDWFRQRYAATLDAALTRIGRPETRVELLSGAAEAEREQGEF